MVRLCLPCRVRKEVYLVPRRVEPPARAKISKKRKRNKGGGICAPRAKHEIVPIIVISVG